MSTKDTRGQPTAKYKRSKVSLEPAAPPRPLSPKEKSVLEFLETYIRRQGVSPTYQEIRRHFGFASFNSVQRYLKQLEAKGYVRLPWSNQKRALTLLHPASALQDALENRHGDHGRDADFSHANVLSALPPSSESFTLPLLGRVAAGSPIEAMDHDEFIDVPASLVRHADRTYALRVQGQSMIDDGILDGDVILVQRQNMANNGDIVVAVIGEEATVKRFYLHRRPGFTAQFSSFDDEGEVERPGSGRMIELRPANSSMKPMWYEPNQVQIRGVVVGLIRRLA